MTGQHELKKGARKKDANINTKQNEKQRAVYGESAATETRMNKFSLKWRGPRFGLDYERKDLKAYCGGQLGDMIAYMWTWARVFPLLGSALSLRGCSERFGN